MGINQSFIEDKLKLIGNKYLKSPYKEKWTSDNPTFGYCYVVSECLYHYCYKEYYPHYINMGEEGTHWFLKDKQGDIIDFTAKQFDFKVDYSKAKRGTFFKGSIKTPKGFISKRGYKIAKILEVV